MLYPKLQRVCLTVFSEELCFEDELEQKILRSMAKEEGFIEGLKEEINDFFKHDENVITAFFKLNQVSWIETAEEGEAFLNEKLGQLLKA